MVHKNVTLTATILLGFIAFSNGANILFFFGLSTYSHRITAWPLVEKLIEKGHKVTFLQAHENKHPNPKVEEIFVKLDPAMEATDNVLEIKLKYGRWFQPMFTAMLVGLGEMVCNVTLSDPNVIKWANSNHFDVVIIDALYNDCALGLAFKWKAQTVIFGTSTVFEWWGDDFGFPTEDNWIAPPHFALDMPIGLIGRAFSTFTRLAFRFSKIFMLYPKLEPFLREKLNIPHMPPLQELSSNISLVLMNTHFSEELARSLPPMVIPVGGMHCSDKLKPLPKDLEDFVNSSGSEGFIYVSFGGEVRISNAPKKLLDAFLNAFKNSKARFVWKWEGERPASMPSNIFTLGWLNQQSILAHPKIKAFITHGGLLSIQEALYYKVPMISFPIFAEQDYNAERIHRTKRGIRLQINTVTQADIEGAINSILTDDTYQNNVNKASVLFKDRPQSPVDTALWWLEYVMRHKEDSAVLRPLAVSQWWFQKRNLDVWAFFIGISIFILGSFIVMLKMIFSCFCGRKQVKPKIKIKSKRQ